MAWSNPSTVIAGQVLNATKWNQDVVANTEFLARPPSCRVERSTEQSIANAVWRSVSWNTEIWDTNSMWSSTAATRIDINTSGKYVVAANIPITNSSGGNARWLGVSVGGSSTAQPNKGFVNMTPLTGSQIPAMGFTTILSLSSTQYIRVQVLQDSGSALDILHSADGIWLPSCSVLWVSS